jgi:hypothetical protein
MALERCGTSFSRVGQSTNRRLMLCLEFRRTSIQMLSVLGTIARIAYLLLPNLFAITSDGMIVRTLFSPFTMKIDRGY